MDGVSNGYPDCYCCVKSVLIFNFLCNFSLKNNFPRTLLNVFISGIIRIQKILYLEVLTQALLKIRVFFILHCYKLRNVRMGHFENLCCLLFYFIENPKGCGKNLWGITCVFYFATIFHLKQSMFRRKCIN